MLNVFDKGWVTGAATFTELFTGTSVPIMKELPGVPVGPGVKTRFPPA